MADVPTADVVLVNPTHVAVALRYEPERGRPAGGRQGRRRGRRRGSASGPSRARVPLVRDVPLARALLHRLRGRPGDPAELFAAVAQVLAFVISRAQPRPARRASTAAPRAEADLPAVPRRRPTRRRSPSTPQVRLAAGR